MKYPAIRLRCPPTSSFIRQGEKPYKIPPMKEPRVFFVKYLNNRNPAKADNTNDIIIERLKTVITPKKWANGIATILIGTTSVVQAMLIPLGNS